MRPRFRNSFDSAIFALSGTMARIVSNPGFSRLPPRDYSTANVFQVQLRWLNKYDKLTSSSTVFSNSYLEAEDRSDCPREEMQQFSYSCLKVILAMTFQFSSSFNFSFEDISTEDTEVFKIGTRVSSKLSGSTKLRLEGRGSGSSSFASALFTLYSIHPRLCCSSHGNAAFTG